MDKVILLSDTEQLPKGAFDFACWLNEQQSIHLEGVFVSKVDYQRALHYYSSGSAAPVDYYTPATRSMSGNEAAAQFARLCRQYGIEYHIHEKQRKDIKEELEMESRSADLIILGKEPFFEEIEERLDNRHASEGLHIAQCPVAAIPDEFRKPGDLN